MGLTAVITLSAIVPLANATVTVTADSTDTGAFSQIIAAAPSSMEPTKPSDAKTKKITEEPAEEAPERSTGRTAEKSAEKIFSPISEMSSTESSESTVKGEPKEFPPLVLGAKTQWSFGIQTRLDEVAEKFDVKGGMLGMDILDCQTGEFICNAHCDDAFRLASLMKVLVADIVVYSSYTQSRKDEIIAGQGDMPVEDNPDAMLCDDTIRRSNSEAVDELWDSYGGVRIVDNIRQRYDLSDRTVGSSMQGATASTPADMVAYFDRMLGEEGGLGDTETKYIHQLMYSLPRYSYGDTDQNFGLRVVLPKRTIANKSGWYEKQRTTAEFLSDNDRYTIAILDKNLATNDLIEAVKYVLPDRQVLSAGDKETGHARTNAPLSIERDSNKAASALWALVTALASFGIGWLIRDQRVDQMQKAPAGLKVSSGAGTYETVLQVRRRTICGLNSGVYSVALSCAACLAIYARTSSMFSSEAWPTRSLRAVSGSASEYWNSRIPPRKIDSVGID